MSKEINLKQSDVAALAVHPKNRNKHSKEQVDRLAELITYHGFRVPIIVSNLTNRVVSGHGRLLAAKKLGLETVPVLYQDFENEDAEYVFAVSDNAIALWADLDLKEINVDLPELGPDFDIDMLGIKDFVLDPYEKEGLTEDDAVPESAPSVCKLGELWELGAHRLLCGDCTVAENVERLMGGEKAELFLTDPPYGVSYMAKNAAVHGGIVKNQTGKQITDDTLSLEEISPVWKSAAENAFAASSKTASYYWFACQGGDQMMMMMMMMIGEAGWLVRHELIWVKPSMVFGRSDYHYRHEPIIYGWKRKGTHNFYADRKQTSVLEFERPHKSDLHPTTKPVELISYLMMNSSKSNDVVLDLFLGSGTTLIAAEKFGRRCYGMEIDPHYCDVIIKRWEDFTGQKAKRIEESPVSS